MSWSGRALGVAAGLLETRQPTVRIGYPPSIATPIIFQMKCPICKKTAEWEENPYRPFCSRRCQLIDLGNWATEKYGLPFESDLPSDEEENQIDQE